MKFWVVACCFSLLLVSCGDKRKNGAITQDGEKKVEELAEELEEILRYGTEDEFHEMMIAQFATEEDYRLIFSEEISDQIIEQMVYTEGLTLEMLEAGSYKPGTRALEDFRLGKYGQREEKSYRMEELIENGKNDKDGSMSQQKQLGYWAEDEFFKPEVQFFEVRFSDPQIDLPEAVKKWGPSDPRWGPFFWNGTSWKMLRLHQDHEVYIETQAKILNGRASERLRKAEEKYLGMGAEERHIRKTMESSKRSISIAEESLRKKEKELADFLSQRKKRSQLAEKVSDGEVAKNREQMEKQRAVFSLLKKRIERLRASDSSSKELEEALRLSSQIFQEFKESKKLDDHYSTLRDAKDPEAEERLRGQVEKARKSLEAMKLNLKKARERVGES